MNHIHAVFQCNPNDILLSKVRPNRRQPLPNQVTLVTLVPVSTHPVLKGIDSDGGHGELMRCPEDTDSDLSTISDEDFLQGTSMTGLLVPQRLDAMGC